MRDLGWKRDLNGLTSGFLVYGDRTFSFIAGANFIHANSTDGLAFGDTDKISVAHLFEFVQMLNLEAERIPDPATQIVWIEWKNSLWSKRFMPKPSADNR